jgi:hypothetical protein
VQLARLAAAANPLLLPVSRAVDLAVERWADDAAARTVGDRITVARALAAAALAHVRVPNGTLAAAQSNVVDRVRVLLQPPPRRGLVGALIGAAVVACWLAAMIVAFHVHGLMETAELAARPGGRAGVF